MFFKPNINRLRDKIVGKRARLAAIEMVMNNTDFPAYLLEESINLSEDIASMQSRLDRLTLEQGE